MKKTLFILLTLLTALLVCISCDNSLDADVFTPDPTPEPGAKGIPLTLEFISDGELSIELKYGYSPCDVYYSKNGGDKTLFEDLEPVFVKAGDKVALYRTLSEAKSIPPVFIVHCSSDCYVYGNVMSLIDPDIFATATDVYDYSFAELFAGNTHIKNHDSIDLVLPATKLAVGCYNAMFEGCIALTKAPELPATTLAEACYATMFQGCTGLTKAPILPATTLADACYDEMFKGCTDLTKAPELPAEELKAFCYFHMFYGCSKLSSITCLATNISAGHCVDEWLTDAGTDVTETKTFYRSQSVDDSFWSGNIGTGWTIQPAQ